MRLDTPVFSFRRVVHCVAISAPVSHRMKQPERSKHRRPLRRRISSVRYNLVGGFSHVLIFFRRRHAPIIPFLRWRKQLDSNQHRGISPVRLPQTPYLFGCMLPLHGAHGGIRTHTAQYLKLLTPAVGLRGLKNSEAGDPPHYRLARRDAVDWTHNNSLLVKKNPYCHLFSGRLRKNGPCIADIHSAASLTDNALIHYVRAPRLRRGRGQLRDYQGWSADRSTIPDPQNHNLLN